MADEMIKKSFDKETGMAMLEWGRFIIHIDINTGMALYFKKPYINEEYPDYKMFWSGERLDQAKAAVGLISAVIRTDKKSSLKCNYYCKASGSTSEYIKTVVLKESARWYQYIQINTDGQYYIGRINCVVNLSNYNETTALIYETALKMAEESIYKKDLS